ncbi:hypothetical protein ACFX11_000328 [Malus domestica]
MLSRATQSSLRLLTVYGQKIPPYIGMESDRYVPITQTNIRFVWFICASFLSFSCDVEVSLERNRKQYERPVYICAFGYKLELFASGISVGDVSWPTSAQLPRRLAPVEGCCRASALLSGFVRQGSSGRAYRARLVGQGWKRRTALTLKGAFVGA